MPEILSRVKRRKKAGVPTKCRYCKTTAKYFPDEYWTEYGNTYTRCMDCQNEIFLGRLGLPDTY